MKMLHPPIPCSGTGIMQVVLMYNLNMCSARNWLCIPFLESCIFIFLIYLLFLTFPLTFSKSEDFLFWSTGKCQRGLLRWDGAARSAGGSVFGFEVECRRVNSNQDTDCYCSTEKELNGWLIWSLANQSVDLLTTSSSPIMFSICNLEVKTVDGYLCSQCWVCLMVSWLDKLGIVWERERQRMRKERLENAVQINYIIVVCDYPDLQSMFVFLLFICLFQSKTKALAVFWFPCNKTLQKGRFGECNTVHFSLSFLFFSIRFFSKQG